MIKNNAIIQAILAYGILYIVNFKLIHDHSKIFVEFVLKLDIPVLCVWCHSIVGYLWSLIYIDSFKPSINAMVSLINHLLF